MMAGAVIEESSEETTSEVQFEVLYAYIAYHNYYTQKFITIH